MDVQGKRGILFGDSQMEGISRTLKRLLEEAGAEVAVSAHRGMSLKTAYTTLPNETEGYDFVVLSFGGNNPPPNKSVAIAQMDRMLSEIGNKTIFWISVLPAEDRELQVGRGRMETWQKEYLPTRSVHVIDGRALTSDLPRSDGLHLAGSSYTTFAVRVFSAMKSATNFPWKPVIFGAIVGIVTAVASTRTIR